MHLSIDLLEQLEDLARSADLSLLGGRIGVVGG